MSSISEAITSAIRHLAKIGHLTFYWPVRKMLLSSREENVSEPAVLMEVSNGLAVVTLNRPDQLNAMNVQLDSELAEALKAAAGDSAIRCVLITGAGRVFSVGGDMNDDNFAVDDPSEAFLPTIGFVEPMQDPGTIFIAAINGAIAGGALGIAMAADFRLASSRAHFTAGFAPIGLNPDMGSSHFLVQAMGYARALHFFLLGSRVPAENALAMGLVEQIIPADDFAADARAVAQRIADLPPLAVRETKRLLRSAERDPAMNVFWDEAATVARLLKTSDFHEGVAAFMEKRSPVFAGA
jgi:2-(1,2-epoxy-1,2-dihydrophenyl)acetyl-CoA isomerase